MRFIVYVTMLAAAVLMLAGCGGDAAGDTSEPAPAPAATVDAPATEPAAEQDPYQRYLELAPAGAPELSPTDAQARALLGCQTEYAPGTVDAALQEAYADVIASTPQCQ